MGDILPFQTTDKQIANLAFIADEYKALGLDNDFIKEAMVVASIDQGVYDEVVLLLDVIKDIEEAIDNYKNQPIEDHPWVLARRCNYEIFWSEEDGQYVGKCKQFPSLSCLDYDATDVLDGIMKLVKGAILDMKINGENIDFLKEIK
jgi:hypothetical protein